MSLVNNFARGMNARLIAQRASSFEAFDGGTAMPHKYSHSVRDFFRKYGSTAKKFRSFNGPDTYFGFVKISGFDEFLSVIVMTESGAFVVSFYPELDLGNDSMSVVLKETFAEKTAISVQRAIKFAPRATPQAQPAPNITQPRQVNHDTNKDGSEFVSLIIILLLVAVGIAVVAFLA